MTKKYFTGLNYTLGNEDTSVEFKMVKKLRPKAVFTVCGSGGRALPLVGEACEKIDLVDLSKEQLLLADLRLATYKQFDHDSFLKFWGYFPFHDNDNCDFRKKTFYALELDIETKTFFEKVFIELEFHSVLYIGKWERTFATLAKINQTILGSDFDQILRFDHLSDQISYYQGAFPILKWKAVLFLLGNKSIFNALLYKGDFIEKNSKLSHFEYYFEAFNRLFTTDLAKKSFFLQLCFYGKINSLEGVPIEASSEVFDFVKRSNAKIGYINKDFVTYLSSGVSKYDFLSLSDVPSYFKGEVERDYLKMIKPSLNDGAYVVVRYYLRTCHTDLDGYTDVTAEFKDEILFEKVQMYDIRIYKYQSK